MSTEPDARTRILTAARQRAPGVLLEILVNFVLPYIIYSQTRAHLGDVKALITSAAPPILWSLFRFAHDRRVDFISAFVLLGIALSLLALAGGGSVKFLQLRERLVTVVIGLVFLISALIRRPIIYEFARAGMKRSNSHAQLADLEARKDDPRLRRAMTVMSLVWGIGLLLDAAVGVGLVMVLSIKQYLIIGRIVGHVITGLLALWTFLYVRELRRRAAAGRPAEDEAALAQTQASS